MKKKIKDMTVEEVCIFCGKQHRCFKCPLRKFCKSRKKRPGVVTYASINEKVEVEVDE